MEKVELNIIALSHSVTQSHNYAVVLGEIEGNRRLPIVIGGFEAQAIAVAMEGMRPTRPLTHDLFRNTMETFQIKLKEVVISNLVDGVFFARLICELNGEQVEIDSRTSDAIALAVRFECPIYTFEAILEQAGVVLEDPSESKAPPERKAKADSIENMSLDTLEEMLDKVLKAENYEKAAEIRDEINKRKGEGGN